MGWLRLRRKSGLTTSQTDSSSLPCSLHVKVSSLLLFLMSRWHRLWQTVPTVYGFMLACVGKHFDWSIRQGKPYIQEVKSVYCRYTEKPSWILKSALVRLFRHSTLGVVLIEISNWEQIECIIIIGQTQTTYTRESIIIAPCSAGTGETNQQSPRQKNNTDWKCEAKYDTRRQETLQNETGSS